MDHVGRISSLKQRNALELSVVAGGEQPHEKADASKECAARHRVVAEQQTPQPLHTPLHDVGLLRNHGLR
jgi:hypothetical protein